jgi:hypothetical protein
MMPEKKNDHGGRRPGAGRPKGSVERLTSGNLKHFRERYPIQPLDHMMNVINAPPGTKGVTDERRDRMAMAAAPYLPIVRARARKGGAAVFDGSQQADRRRADRI